MSKRCPKIREGKSGHFSPGIASVLLFLVVAVLAQITRRPQWADWFGKEIGLGGLSHFNIMVLLIGFSTGLACLTAWLANRHMQRLQPLRDTALVSTGPKALFLRPFFSDKKLASPNPFYSMWSAGISMEAGNLPLVQFVGRILEPFIDVIQVGGSPATVANATLSVAEDRWKPAVVEAVQAVSVVIILPILTVHKKTGTTLGEGTLWELEHLVKSGRIAESIVIMPREIWLRRNLTRKGWERARVRALEFSLILPEYNQTGATLIFAQADGFWRVAQTFGDGICKRRRLAVSLVEALNWLAERNSFELLNR